MLESLPHPEIDSTAERVAAAADAGDLGEAWSAASTLREMARRADRRAAAALLRLARRPAFSSAHVKELAGEVFAAHGDDDALLAALGWTFERAQEIRFLNAPPLAGPPFVAIAERLRARATAARGTDAERTLAPALATAARFLGRAWDATAEDAHRRVVAIEPTWERHYDLGLFYKVRGRFAEGLAANRRAADVGGAHDESVRWNLGICATGARDGDAALAVWQALGQRIEMGRFALPEGRYDMVKVYLAERPVAERGADHDEPGREESIWVERLSPCHGIIRSALFYDVGVDYGDVVLFDGAPITHHTYGEQQVAVFPHLATLERPGYRIFPFVGTQPGAKALEALSMRLPDDTVLYSHTEHVLLQCAACFDDGGDHAAHQKDEERHHIVRGKLCAPPHLAPADLRRTLDDAIAASPGVRVYVPELSRLLGDGARAEVETRRIAMIGSG